MLGGYTDVGKIYQDANYNGTLTTTADTSLIALDASTTLIITGLVISNSSATDKTVTIKINGKRFMAGVIVPAYNSIIQKLDMPLAPGSTITGSASASSVIDYHIWGTKEIAETSSVSYVDIEPIICNNIKIPNVTLTATDWVNDATLGFYKYVVNSSLIESYHTAIVKVAPANLSDSYTKGLLYDQSLVADTSITIYCKTKPTVNYTVDIFLITAASPAVAQ
jgi:hypothetical protein